MIKAQQIGRDTHGIGWQQSSTVIRPGRQQLFSRMVLWGLAIFVLALLGGLLKLFT